MKLLYCENCHDLVRLFPAKTKKCDCGQVAGKYLKDDLTAVVTANAVVCGIDNNSLQIARIYYNHNKNRVPSRVDYYFVGWIPTHPGEVVIVDTVEEVDDFPYETEINETSTIPVKE